MTRQWGRAHFPFFSWLDTFPGVFLFLESLTRTRYNRLCVWKWHHISKSHSFGRRAHGAIFIMVFHFTELEAKRRRKVFLKFLWGGRFDSRENQPKNNFFSIHPSISHIVIIYVALCWVLRGNFWKVILYNYKLYLVDTFQWMCTMLLEINTEMT